MDRFNAPLLLEEIVLFYGGGKTRQLHGKRYVHVNMAVHSEPNFRGGTTSWHIQPTWSDDRSPVALRTQHPHAILT